MAKREILKIGHPTLAKKAAPVTAIDEDLVRLAGDMVETLHAAPGVGLAAPQVDVSRRLIVVDLSIGEDPEDLIILVNPEIVDQEGQIVCEEGCLSVPDITRRSPAPTGSGSGAWISKDGRHLSKARICWPGPSATRSTISTASSSSSACPRSSAPW